MTTEQTESDEPTIDDQRRTPESAATMAWLREIAAPLRPSGAHLGLWYRQANSTGWEYRVVCYAGYYQDINTAGDGYAVIDDVPGNPIAERNESEVARLIRGAVAASEKDRDRQIDPVMRKVREHLKTVTDLDVKFWIAARVWTDNRAEGDDG